MFITDMFLMNSTRVFSNRYIIDMFIMENKTNNYVLNK